MACLQEQTTVACKKPVLNNPFIAQTTGKSPASQGSGQVAGQGTVPNAGNGLLQINAGPGALAMSMIFEAMDLYASIINLQKQQKVSMIKTQADSAQAQADETVAEGKAALEAAWVAGGITIGMAVGSLVAAGAMQKVMGKNNAADEERLNTKLKPMQSVEGNLEEKPWSVTTGESTSTTPSNEVQARMDKLQNHEYENLPNDADTKEAVRRLKSQPGYQNWKKGFYERYDAGRMESLGITNRQNAISQYTGMASQLCSSAGNAGSQVATAYGTKAQAKHRAAASLDQVSSSMAGGNSQESAQAMSKAADAQSQEVQILREIDRANSVA